MVFGVGQFSDFSDSPGGATTNSKMSEFGCYRHVYYTIALMYAKKSYNYLL